MDGHLRKLEYPDLTPDVIKALAYSVLTDAQKKKFEESWELDLAFGLRGVGRFRCNVFNQKGAVGAVLRLIPEKIRSLEELGLPPVLAELADRPRGLVLVTGPTGSGKSTTLAAMIDRINLAKPAHILTIEDPIEYLHHHKTSLVNQRELHADTQSFTHGAPRRAARGPGRRARRRNARPRDDGSGDEAGRDGPLDDGDAAHQLGGPDDHADHRRLSGAPAVADPHPALARARRHRLSGARAEDRAGRGRVAALEILVATPAIRNLIRDDKIHQIYGTMQAGQEKLGMQTMNQSLARLVERRVISRDQALTTSSLRDELITMLERGSSLAHPSADGGRTQNAPGSAGRAGSRTMTTTTFAWVGRTRTGQIVKGERPAESPDALTAQLKREQILVTKVSAAAQEGGALPARPVAQPRHLHAAVLRHDRRRPAARPVSRAARQGRARQAPRRRDRRASASTSRPASSLADAMQKRPYAFDALFTNMVAAGEAGGILDVILKRLSTFIEKQAKLVSQVRSAMIYPIAVLSIAAIVVIVIMVKVVPTFTTLFEGLGAQLPLATRVVICGQQEDDRGAAVPPRRALRRPVPVPPVLPDAGRADADRRDAASGCRSSARSSGRSRWRGSAGRSSTLLSSGVPILNGLDITAKTSGNAIIEKADHAGARTHRARRHDRRAAQGRRRVSADGGADDRRR